MRGVPPGSSIAEFTPQGAFVQLLSLPPGVSSISGIGLDDGRGEIWLSGTGGDVWRLGGIHPVPERGSLVLAATGAFCGVIGWGWKQRRKAV